MNLGPERFLREIQIVVHELTIIGSRCGPFPKALSLLAGTLKIVFDVV